MTRTYRTGPAERSIVPGPAVTIAPTIGAACMRVSRAQDGRTFACARLAGHDGACYGADGTGYPVRLGCGVRS